MTRETAEYHVSCAKSLLIRLESDALLRKIYSRAELLRFVEVGEEYVDNLKENELIDWSAIQDDELLPWEI